MDEVSEVLVRPSLLARDAAGSVGGAEEDLARGGSVIRGLRIFGIVWIWVVVALIVGGNLAFLYFAESKLDALGKIRDDLNPFNVAGLLVKLLLMSPGVVALVLSDRLKARSTRASPTL